MNCPNLSWLRSNAAGLTALGQGDLHVRFQRSISAAMPTDVMAADRPARDAARKR